MGKLQNRSEKPTGPITRKSTKKQIEYKTIHPRLYPILPNLRCGYPSLVRDQPKSSDRSPLNASTPQSVHRVLGLARDPRAALRPELMKKTYEEVYQLSTIDYGESSSQSST